MSSPEKKQLAKIALKQRAVVAGATEGAEFRGAREVPATPRPPQVEVSELSVEELALLEDDLGGPSSSSDISWEEFSEVAPAPDVRPVKEAPQVGAKSKTVLVVDPDDETRSLIDGALRAKGYRVVVAKSGRVALGLVKKEPPDLILLDATLPEVQGLDVTRRIKQTEIYRHIPVITMSAVYRGWRFAEDVRQAYGVAQHLEKPVKVADVLLAVEAACSPSGVPSDPSPRPLAELAQRALGAGVTAFQAGRIDEAIDHLRKGLSLDPQAIELHFHLGVLYGKKDLVYDAIAELERAVDLDSRYFPALRNLAILYQKAGFRNRAADMWQRASIVAPDDATRQTIKKHLFALL